MKNLIKLILSVIMIISAGCEFSGSQLRLKTQPSASARAFPHGIEVFGIRLTETLATVDTTTGPTGSKNAFTSAENEIFASGALNVPLTTAGSASFWIYSDRQFRSTFDDQTLSQRVLTIDGLARMGFHGKDPGDNCPSLFMVWDNDIKDVHDLRVLLPEIPADTWLHIVFTWDSEEGLANAYINGTPLRPSSDVPPWKTTQYSSIKIHSGILSVADITIHNQYLSETEIRAMVDKEHKGVMDKYLGLTELGDISEEYVSSLKGELHYFNPLSQESDVDNWVMEGPGEVEFEDGWMVMQSTGADDPEPLQGHIVNWCDFDMPEDFVATWDYRMLSEYGLTIIFFCAKGVDGSDIFSPHLAERDGVFRHYIIGDIDSYHISYQAHGPDGGGRRTSHLRKNSGFALAANGPVGVTPGSNEPHKITLIKNGDHIQMAVDGRLIIDFKEDGSLGDTHGEGKMGFRQMKWTKAAYRNFRVYEIK